jgi:hypothetical protein
MWENFFEVFTPIWEISTRCRTRHFKFILPYPMLNCQNTFNSFKRKHARQLKNGERQPAHHEFI